MKLIFLLFLLTLSLISINSLSLQRRTTFKFISEAVARMLKDPAKVDAKTKVIQQAMQGIQKAMNNDSTTGKAAAGNLTKQETKVKELKNHIQQTKKVEQSLNEIAKEIKDPKKKAEYQKKVGEVKNVINNLLKGLKKLTTSSTDVKVAKKETAKKAAKLANDTKKAEKQIKKQIENIKKKADKELEKPKFRSTESGSGEGGREVAGLAKACFQAAISAVPGEFCWKKGADFGKIPTGCPANWERHLALCFEKCKSGYTHFGGVCWEVCSGGYKNIGLICSKSFFTWHWKRSYIPSSLTNFNSRIPCPDGMYKGGALCYRDCNKIGMTNCGIGACSSDSTACGFKIAGMVVETIVTIGGLVLDVISLGSTKGLTTAAKTAASKLGKEGLRKAFLRSKTFIEKQVTSNLKSFAKSIAQKAKKFLAKQLMDRYTEFQVEQFCENTVKGIREIAGKKNEPTDSFKGIDFLGVLGAAKTCSKPLADTNAKLECAKGVLEAVGTLDPTGIIGLAAAFVNPICEGV